MQGPRVSTVLRVLSSVGLALVSGCQSPPPAAEQASPRAAASTLSTAPVSLSEPQVELGDDVLLMLTASKLLSFDGSELREVATPAGPLLDLFVGPEGRVHLLSAAALFQAGEAGFTELESFGDAGSELRGLGELRGALPRPGGALYLRGSEGIAWRSEAGWEVRRAESLGYPAGTGLELAYDASQRMWIVGPQRAIYREVDTGEWREMGKSTLGQGFEFGNARALSVGPVHVNNEHRLTRIHPDFLDSVLIDPKRTRDYELLAVSGTGDALVATRDCELGRVNAHPPTRVWRFASDDYACERAEAIALDSERRAWVASEQGLSAISDTRELVEHSRAQLPGLEGEVLRMVVLGTGPR